MDISCTRLTVNHIYSQVAFLFLNFQDFTRRRKKENFLLITACIETTHKAMARFEQGNGLQIWWGRNRIPIYIVFIQINA